MLLRRYLLLTNARKTDRSPLLFLLFCIKSGKRGGIYFPGILRGLLEGVMKVDAIPATGCK